MNLKKPQHFTVMLMTILMIFVLAFPASAASGRWKQNSKGWWYSYIEGGYARDQWAQIRGDWYHFDSDGYMQTGWLKSGGKWYFLDTSGVMRTGWVKSSGKWYFLDDSGVMQTGWIRNGNKWYYLDASGMMCTGWVKTGGKWYYLDQSGVMQTGWLKLNNKWYYLDDDGAMQTGWIQAGSAWYYMDASGVMQTGWIKPNGKWYYLLPNGRMAIGWQIIDGKAYYFNSSGAYTRNSSALISEELRSFLENIYNHTVTEQMTQEQKLRAVFEHVADRSRYPYKSVRIPYYHETDWPFVYAADRMNSNYGDCHSYASLFGYLAVMCGYTDVHWCAKNDHAWVEVNGRVYDPVYLESVYQCDVFGLTYAEAIYKNPFAGYDELIRTEGTFRYIRVPLY